MHVLLLHAFLADALAIIHSPSPHHVAILQQHAIMYYILLESTMIIPLAIATNSIIRSPKHVSIWLKVQLRSKKWAYVEVSKYVWLFVPQHHLCTWDSSYPGPTFKCIFLLPAWNTIILWRRKGSQAGRKSPD